MPDLLSAAETAAELEMSTETVARLARTGELEYAHKNPGPTGAYVFDAAVVRLFKKARKRPRAHTRRRGQDATPAIREATASWPQ